MSSPAIAAAVHQIDVPCLGAPSSRAPRVYMPWLPRFCHNSMRHRVTLTALGALWHALPAMRAIVISRPGGPEALVWREVADPEPGPDEVRIDVRATAVNRADLLQRRGLYPAPADAPADIPGLEFAGEVETSGSRVRTLRRGDRVMGLVAGGAYAERLVVHEKLCLRVPPALDWTAAAAVPEAFITAYDALFRRARLAAGEALLVQAAASGVGTAAVQLAAVAGARVLALSRSPKKRTRLEALGARAFDPAAADVADAIRLAAGADGVDAVLDLVGAPAWPLHATVLAERGRIVLVGLLGGARAEVDLSTLMRKRLTVVGTVLRPRSLHERIELVQEFGRRVLPLLSAGRVRPVVDEILELPRAAEAHARMERDEHFGKIVLNARPSGA